MNPSEATHTLAVASPMKLTVHPLLQLEDVVCGAPNESNCIKPIATEPSKTDIDMLASCISFAVVLRKLSVLKSMVVAHVAASLPLAKDAEDGPKAVCVLVLMKLIR